jgi:RHS repeat-associated protein
MPGIARDSPHFHPVTTDSLARRSTTTLYLEGFIYQQTDTISKPGGGVDTLQFMGHEEGRARWALHRYQNGTTKYGWEYDFMEKDHLGNTRMLLTQQRDTAKYIATMEGAYRNTENALFYNVAGTAYPRASVSGYPTDVNVTNPNDSVAKLNGNGPKVGPAIILKVMSGDVVDFSTQYYYNSPGTNGGNLTYSDLLNGLASGLVSISGGVHGSFADLTGGSSTLSGALTSFINSNNPQQGTGKPQAFINWMLFDNQLKYDSVHSGAISVGAAGSTGGVLQSPIGRTGFSVQKSGYLYIYVSNGTPGWDVFFDNLSVQHRSGPMLEENHYYPFGLTMAGISDKALKASYAENKNRFNGQNELQSREFSDGSGLELYDAVNRMYDPQIGRFGQIDLLADVGTSDWSPYAFALDNPFLINDPVGLSGDSTNCDGCMAPAIVTARKPGSKPKQEVTATGPSTSSVTVVPPAGSNQSSTSAANFVIPLTLGVLGGQAVEITITDVGSSYAAVPAFAIAGYLSLQRSWQNTYSPTYNPVGDITIGLRTPSIDVTKPFVVALPLSQVTTKVATLPPFTHKVYEIGGWDLANMKWQTLKYGVASMAYDTYGGEGNRRPDSQLAGMRNDYPMLMIRQITLAYFPDKASAHAFETGMVQLYKARNKGQSPPEQGLPK